MLETTANLFVQSLNVARDELTAHFQYFNVLSKLTCKIATYSVMNILQRVVCGGLHNIYTM